MTTPYDASRDPDAPDLDADVPADPVDAARDRVMAALSDIDDVAGWPPADQVVAYTTAHRTLQATLAGIDDH